MAQTSLQRLEENAQTLAEREAYVDGERRLTWSDVRELTRSLAGSLLRQGLPQGDVVFLQVPNSAMAVVVRFALKRAGLLGALIPMQWRSTEIAQAVARARPAAAIVDPSFKGFDFGATWDDFGDASRSVRLFSLGDASAAGFPRVTELAGGTASAEASSVAQRSFRNDDVSWLLCSSGSTGAPKLLQWTEAAQLLTAETGVEDMALTPTDVVGVYAPLSGYAGMYASLWSMACPVRTVLVQRFDPEHLLSVIQSERISVLSTVPPVLARIIAADRAKRFDLSSLRAVRVGTAQFSPALRHKAEDVLGCSILAAAGSMETGVYAQCRLSDEPRARLSDAVGKPPRSTTCIVVDDTGHKVPAGQPGELVVRSAIGACGYYGDPEGTERAWNRRGMRGWYHTSDLATISPHGAVTLLGRKSDIINRGGNKVLPLELEAAILRHPGVAECAVVGVADATMGEVPCAWVVARETQDQANPTELRQFLGETGLASYKLPAHIVLVERLPLLGNGKVDRRRLREDFDAGR